MNDFSSLSSVFTLLTSGRSLFTGGCSTFTGDFLLLERFLSPYERTPPYYGRFLHIYGRLSSSRAFPLSLRANFPLIRAVFHISEDFLLLERFRSPYERALSFYGRFLLFFERLSSSRAFPLSLRANFPLIRAVSLFFRATFFFSSVFALLTSGLPLITGDFSTFPSNFPLLERFHSPYERTLSFYERFLFLFERLSSSRAFPLSLRAILFLLALPPRYRNVCLSICYIYPSHPTFPYQISPGYYISYFYMLLCAPYSVFSRFVLLHDVTRPLKSPLIRCWKSIH